MNGIRLFTFFIFIIPVLALAQGIEEDNFENELFNIPSLEVILDSAKARSPLLKKYDFAIAAESFNVSFERRRWMDYLYFEGNSRYGLYDHVYFRGGSDEIEPPLAFVNQRKQTTYYGGLSLKLPFSTILNQKKHVQQTKNKIEIIRCEREMMADELNTQIIEVYYKALFGYESMNTFYTVYQDLNIAYLDAQNRLLDQSISIHDYSILSSTYGKAKNDYIKAKSEFLISLSILRYMTGWNF